MGLEECRQAHYMPRQHVRVVRKKGMVSGRGRWTSGVHVKRAR